MRCYFPTCHDNFHNLLINNNTADCLLIKYITRANLEVSYVCYKHRYMNNLRTACIHRRLESVVIGSKFNITLRHGQFSGLDDAAMH